MDITRFYQDLLKYQLENPNLVELNPVIAHVENLLEEIRLDHAQGDADDQERG